MLNSVRHEDWQGRYAGHGAVVLRPIDRVPVVTAACKASGVLSLEPPPAKGSLAGSEVHENPASLELITREATYVPGQILFDNG